MSASAVSAQAASSRGAQIAWFGCVALAIALPWFFYDWSSGRHSGFMVSMFSQTGMMVIFALSYNMLMGQAGMLSFCHAVFFGIGGYVCIHLLTSIGKDSVPITTERSFNADTIYFRVPSSRVGPLVRIVRNAGRHLARSDPGWSGLFCAALFASEAEPCEVQALAETKAKTHGEDPGHRR